MDSLTTTINKKEFKFSFDKNLTSRFYNNSQKSLNIYNLIKYKLSDLNIFTNT